LIKSRDLKKTIKTQTTPSLSTSTTFDLEVKTEISLNKPDEGSESLPVDVLECRMSHDD